MSLDHTRLRRPLALSRRGLLAGGGALGLTGLLTACGTGTENAAAPTASGAWSFTDDRGETVELDAAPQTVVAFTGLAAALYDYGVEVAAVFGPTVLGDGSPDLQAGRMPVDDLTIIGNAWGEFDLETYAAVGPQLLVSHYHEGFPLWYVPEDVTGEVESLAPTLGIGVAERPIEDVLERHRELAAALGADLESEAVTAGRERYEAAVEAVREAAAANPVNVLACNGYPEFFYVANPAQFDVLALCAELGVDLVVPEEPDEAGYWEPLSWEHADKYEADVALLDQRTGNLQAEDLVDFPTWNAIGAVRAGQVTPWNPEPVYSETGVAIVLESIAAAIRDAEPVT
jgi:iron complex transport system substrate-binding protein